MFDNCFASENYEGMKNTAILTPPNKDVNRINDIVSKLPGEYKIYFSHDTVKEQPKEALEFTTEFLNTIKISNLPLHEMKLKIFFNNAVA